MLSVAHSTLPERHGLESDLRLPLPNFRLKMFRES